MQLTAARSPTCAFHFCAARAAQKLLKWRGHSRCYAGENRPFMETAAGRDRRIYFEQSSASLSVLNWEELQ